jgi:Zn-dependent protease
MRESIRLGRIAGIPVGLNISVFGIMLILVVGLAFGRFPVEVPGQSTAAYLLAGIAAAVLFFASLLAHELAHAVVARRNAVDVDGITLWLFGGVARIRSEAVTPGADFRIAVVGPLTSLVVGIVCSALATALMAAGARGWRLTCSPTSPRSTCCSRCST